MPDIVYPSLEGPINSNLKDVTNPSPKGCASILEKGLLIGVAIVCHNPPVQCKAISCKDCNQLLKEHYSLCKEYCIKSGSPELFYNAYTNFCRVYATSDYYSILKYSEEKSKLLDDLIPILDLIWHPDVIEIDEAYKMYYIMYGSENYKQLYEEYKIGLNLKAAFTHYDIGVLKNFDRNTLSKDVKKIYLHCILATYSSLSKGSKVKYEENIISFHNLILIYLGSSLKDETVFDLKDVKITEKIVDKNFLYEQIWLKHLSPSSYKLLKLIN